jgi:RNA polymerase sigma-70 factor (ECF subfamily)
MSKNPDREPASFLLSEARWLRSLAICLAHDEADADDLIQDTWMAAIRTPPEPRGSMRPWLAQVLRNLRRRGLRDGSRRQRREVSACGPDASVAVAPPEDMLVRLELQRLVSELVRDLEEPYRSTLLLRFFEGRSSAEVARALSIPAGTVRWRLNEGLRRLRAQLDQAHGGSRDTWKAALAVPLAAPLPAPGAAPAQTPAAGGTARSATRAVAWAAGGLLLPALVGGLLLGLRQRHQSTPGPDRPIDHSQPRREKINEISNDTRAMNTLLGVVVPALIASADAAAIPERQPATGPVPPAACVPADNPAGCIERLSRAELPPAVEAALVRATSGRKLDKLKIEPRMRKGHATYNVKFEVNDLDEEIDFGADGTFICREIDVAVADLPALVVRAVSAALPDGLVTKAELHNEGALSFHELDNGVSRGPLQHRPARILYEIDVSAPDGKHQLKISEDGKLLKKKVK